MKLLIFIGANWDNILVLFALIAIGILTVDQWIKKNGPIFKVMSSEEKAAYVTRLLKNLVPIALTLVTDAEIEYGSGTGQLKRSVVIDALYARVPDEFKKYITEENLDAIINYTLEQAEQLWADNPNIKALVRGVLK